VKEKGVPAFDEDSDQPFKKTIRLWSTRVM